MLRKLFERLDNYSRAHMQIMVDRLILAVILLLIALVVDIATRIINAINLQ